MSEYKLNYAPQLKLSRDTLRTYYTNLLSMSFTEAACSIGLDKKYPNTNTLRAKAWQIYKSINPDELGIAREIVLAVRDQVERRKGSLDRIRDKTPIEEIDTSDIKDIVLKSSDKAGAVLNKKLQLLLGSKKALQETPLSQIATAFGILFDKRQILMGQATENIAVYAKVSKDMTPEETLNELIKMREVTSEA